MRITLLLLSLATSLPGAENFSVMVAPMVPYKRHASPTMVELKDGRILLAYNEWTVPGETADFDSAVVTARISPDGGRTWNRPHVLKANTSERGRMGPPSLLRLANGEIGLAYGILDSYSDFRWVFERSADEGKTWSEPRPITQDKRYWIMNNHRVIQLRNGRLVAPMAFVPDHEKRRETFWRSMAIVSDDNGNTWRHGKGVFEVLEPVVGAQEPGVVELRDGSVMMFVRTGYERIYRAISTDGGDTWSKPEPIRDLVAPVSPAAIARDPGRQELAMAWNYSPRLRTPLVLALSSDEGQTWRNFNYLEDGYFSYAYPALLFLRNSPTLLVCHWLQEPGPVMKVGLKLHVLDVKSLYEEPKLRPVIR